MSDRRASADAADSLHALTFKTVEEQIKLYTDNVDPETGKPAPLPVPPALLAQAIKLLKDNGIDSPGRAKKLNDDLGARLPDLQDVEEAHMGHA